MKRELVAQAIQIAEQIGKGGQVLVPKDGTPLAALVAAMAPVDGVIQQGSTAPAIGSTATYSPEAFAGTIEYTTGPTSQFNELVNALADDIAPFVTSHISTAKNVVVPLVLEAEDAFNRFIETTATVPAERDFNLSRFEMPELLTDESFLGMGLEKLSGLTEASYSDCVCLTDVEAMDTIVAGACNLGNERLNGLVQKWLAAANHEQMKRTLLTNFYQITPDVSLSSSINERGETLPDGQQCRYFDTYALNGVQMGISNKVSVALAGYLLATWLVDNVQKSTKSLADYRSILEEVRANCAVTLFSSLRRYKIALETKTMVLEYNTRTKNVSVIAPIYRAWLEEGGRPEILYGFLVSNQECFNLDVIKEKAEDGLRAWGNYVSYNNTTAKTRAFDAFEAYVIGYMANSMNALTDLEMAFAGEAGVLNHKNRVAELVKKEIEHFDHRLMDDIQHLALHLVAKARFFFTSAYLILNEMHVAAKENPSIDPREAGSLAAVKYIVSYLADQTTAVKQS